MTIHIIIRLLMMTFMTGLILASVLIAIQFYFSRTDKPQESPVRLEDHKIILPLRLQAYERIVLFLERIAPNNLILRVNRPEMNVIQLQSALIKAIREEFEYNLSQQLYISSKAWEMVNNAKEETIKMINMAAGQVPEAASSAELVRAIFDRMVNTDKLPVHVTLEMVKNEIRQTF
jgi:hypothetical protein